MGVELRGPLAALTLAVVVAATAARADLGDVDAVVADAMARGQVPGLALAVVRDGRVMLLKGYGVRRPGGQPVTPRTLFAGGSIAKSFTVTALSMLADEGRLDWDRPVRDQWPGFRLEEPAAAVTPRDLVTHRTGLPRHDALWYLHAYSRDQLMDRLRHLRPTHDPGQVFQYNNLMVAAAGVLAGRLAGTTWENLVRRRILAPLGMTRTVLTLAEFQAAADRTAPFFMGAEGRITLPLRDTDAIGPAAAVYANLEDMTRWLRFHLAGGVHDGRRLLSAASARAMIMPQVALPGRSPHPELGPRHYGMGFYGTTYRGRRLVRHPGVIDGYAALMAFLPDDGLGVVVLTNLSGRNRVPAAVARSVFDRLLGLEPVDWVARLRVGEPVPPPPDLPPAPGNPPPSHPIEAYAGTYTHPVYGPMRIRVTGAGNSYTLAGTLHTISFALEHVAGDTWRVPETAWPLRRGLAVAFHGPADGPVTHLATPLADGPTYPFSAGQIFFFH